MLQLLISLFLMDVNISEMNSKLLFLSAVLNIIVNGS